MASPAGAWRSKTAALRATGSGPAPAPAAPAASKRSAAKPAIEEPAQGSKQAVDERMLFVASVLIGYTVRVQVKSGVTYEGIFHAVRPAGTDFDVLLRMAKPLAPASNAAAAAGEDWQPVRPTPVLAIEAADLVQITASDVRIGATDVGDAGSAWDDAGGFGTDAAISRSRGNWGRERELQRWSPAEGEESQMLHLEDSMGPPGRGWDQFAVNEAKFGLRTDYAEELYTTALDPSKSKISVAEASRIASEIERAARSGTVNVHQLEERGVAIDDSQMDEEDRYGAVVREAPPARGVNGSAAAAATAAAPQPRPNAWAAGRPRPLLPGAAPSAPISIDPRREANKLRMQMTASGAKQPSPYGTPSSLKRPSPMSSPLISDPSKLDALNLNPGVPRVDEQTRREFEQFKAQQAASKGSSGENMFKKQDLEGYKLFSQSLEGKLSRSLGKDSSMPSQPPSATAAAAAAASPATGAAAGTAAAGAAAGAAAEAGAAAGEAPKAAAAEAAPAAAPAVDGGGEQPAATAAGEGAKKPGLNPNAKSFNFNPNAKSFVFTPGGGAAPAAVAAAPAGGGAAAAHTPAPTGPPVGQQAHGGPMHGGSGHPHMGSSGPHGGSGGGGYRQGPPSPMRGPMPMAQHPAPGIPMPDMRPDFRRLPRGDDGGPGPGSHQMRPERDSSFGRRREESRERGGPGGFDRRRDGGGRHYEGGPGMRGGDGGPPPPPPGKGPGGPPVMQMMPMGPGMVPMGPGMQMMPMMPGMHAGAHGQHMFMVRPMGPGQPTMVPMGPGMVPMGGPGMVGPYGAPYAMHGGMAGSSPGGRPMMMPQMMMMAPGGMVAHGMYGGPHGGGGGPGGKPDDRGE